MMITKPDDCKKRSVKGFGKHIPEFILRTLKEKKSSLLETAYK